MADRDPIADVFTLFAAPLSGAIKSIEQFRKGVDEFLRGVENFNRTMENLNETTERINALVSDLEPPIRAAIPQLTRSIEAADDVMRVVAGPAKAAAPGLEKMAEMMSTPAFTQLPEQLGQFSDVLADLQERVAPLTQIAESAGGLFGGLKFPGMPSSSRSSTRAATRPAAPPEPDTTTSAPEPAEDHKTAATKKSAAKKTAAKKKTAKKKTAAAKK